MESNNASVQQQNYVLSFFNFFPKNSECSVWFLAITELRATWTFLTEFSGLIIEYNGLLFPVAVLKIGIIIFFNLFYFILNFICCFIACLKMLLQSFIAVSEWIILYHPQAFSPCCVSHFHIVHEYIKQHWSWQKTSASCLLTSYL